MGASAHSLYGRSYYPGYSSSGHLNWLIFYTMINGQRREESIDCEHPRNEREEDICREARRKDW